MMSLYKLTSYYLFNLLHQIVGTTQLYVCYWERESALEKERQFT